VQAKSIALLFGAVLTVGRASAYDALDPKNCNGVYWDDKRPLVVNKVIANPRVNFVKSPYDDGFTAASCPADTEACRRTSYLVRGDLVLIGKARNEFTCVVYQSPLAEKQTWAMGWVPTSALQTVASNPHPRMSDWIGKWRHPGGRIEIKKVGDSKLKIEGNMTIPTARDFHTGQIEALVTPQNDTIAFVDDGAIAFEKTNEGECRVRMQRIGPLLLVEDNDGCGGAGVTFTGFYRRKL
jgi:hypothetical protein